MGSKQWVSLALMALMGGTLWTGASAYADTTVTWQQSENGNYDTSQPGTILMLQK